jgi:hypothetical protein
MERQALARCVGRPDTSDLELTDNLTSALLVHHARQQIVNSASGASNSSREHDSQEHDNKRQDNKRQDNKKQDSVATL